MDDDKNMYFLLIFIISESQIQDIIVVLVAISSSSSYLVKYRCAHYMYEFIPQGFIFGFSFLCHSILLPLYDLTDINLYCFWYDELLNIFKTKNSCFFTLWIQWENTWGRYDMSFLFIVQISGFFGCHSEFLW